MMRPYAEQELHALQELGLGLPVEQLFPLVYEELRAISHSWFQRFSMKHTLQPTALVHEVFLRLASNGKPEWDDCAHFKAVAARAMRMVLVDYNLRKGRLKRGAGRARVSLCEDDLAAPTKNTEVGTAALMDALDGLARINNRQAAIVQMRFFGGMTTSQVAAILDVSKRTVELDWNMARVWLSQELRRKGDMDDTGPV